MWGGASGGPALTQVQGEVDGVGVLDPRQHGLALPPSGVLLVVVVRQVHGSVLVPRVASVADVAGLGDAGGAGLDAVLLRGGAAGVGGHHGGVEGGVHELRHAALRSAALVRALVHGGGHARRQAAPRQQSPDRGPHSCSVRPAAPLTPLQLSGKVAPRLRFRFLPAGSRDSGRKHERESQLGVRCAGGSAGFGSVLLRCWCSGLCVRRHAATPDYTQTATAQPQWHDGPHGRKVRKNSSKVTKSRAHARPWRRFFTSWSHPVTLANFYRLYCSFSRL